MTLRYKLRTLLILLAILPPLLWLGWMQHEAWRQEQERLRVRRLWLDELGVLPPPQVFRQQPQP